MAYIAKKGEKWVVVKDGDEGTQYNVIGISSAREDIEISYSKHEGQIVFYNEGAGSGLFGDVIIPRQDIVFSPDSQRMAYVAKKGKNWYAIVNGEPGGKYGSIDVDSMVFSPDSKRFAYYATLTGWDAMTHDESYVLVVDEDKWKPTWPFFSKPVFSPDSQHLAYVTFTGKNMIVVVDENQGKKADFILPSGDQEVEIYYMSGRYFLTVAPGVPFFHFDSSNRLHYIAIKDMDFTYLRVKKNQKNIRSKFKCKIFLVEESLE
jgi:hypothetical protein